ncbi:MAG TPA: FecR domain-containing protein [Chitinophagaceae bacterium]|nr:FecR domain-containing protein [Chitinophagaceae bacterium]
MSSNEQITGIILLYIKGEELTPQQKEVLDNWLNKSAENQQLFSKITDSQFIKNELAQYYSFDLQKAWNKIYQLIEAKQNYATYKNKKQIWLQWAAAAAFAGGLISTVLLYNHAKNKSENNITVTKKNNDVPSPALSKAYIKTDNGKLVAVDSIKVNTVFKINDIEVMKNSDGQIVYTNHSNISSTNTLYNPRGSNIVTLVLSDGSKVWLNSESSITYPLQFDNDSLRAVTITGEAYFEVAKSKTKKFVVTTGNGIKTEVLGTHFNVKNYDDENTCGVTLLEGSVRVSKAQNSVLLVPEQQANYENSFSVKKVNIEKVVAWKTGVFNFEDDDLPTVLKQLSRWYDIHVQINNNVDNSETYSGIISRNLSLMQVLQILKLAGVHYELNQNTLIITKT